MPTIFIDLPHNKGTFEINFKNDRKKSIVKEFLSIIEKYSIETN